MSKKVKSGRVTRGNFHLKRVGLTILRLGLYSCICGIFFMVGIEIGRHEKVKGLSGGKGGNAPEDEIDYGDPAWHDGGGAGANGQGFLPVPNQLRPGEMGKAFVPKKLSEEQKALVKEGWSKNAINQYASDQISVERSLPDVRYPKCKEPNRFLPNLPRASVIMCFHNEAWTILLRSVYSVINRTPPELLKEIVLVDDCSTMDHLKTQLDEYMKKFPKVRIVRAPQRVGLIRARMMGAEVAKGKVLVFLDSHIEATTGWLPPLLDRISRNMSTVVCPVIDVINDDTLEYVHDANVVPEQVTHAIGIFDWSMTPTMAGGLFAINKRFFDRLGRYDPEFDIWGGENLELSFKTWMCGGSLEIVPCSHVGHIFRRRSPYQWREGKNVIKKNLVRLAKVWTDEYGKYYFMRINDDLGDYGNIADRLALRKRLKCKSFKWYIDNIYPEIFIPDRGYAHGEIRNLGLGGRTCLDAALDSKTPNTPIGLYPCHNQGGNQFWTYTHSLEIRRDEMCVDYAGSQVMSFPCHGSRGNQEWFYDLTTKRFTHSTFKKCLTMMTTTNLTMETCADNNQQQQWLLANYDPKKDTSDSKKT